MKRGNYMKKSGLSVRYSFDSRDHSTTDESGDQDDRSYNNTMDDLQVATREMAQTRKPPHHLPKPNFWFHQAPSADMKWRNLRRGQSADGRFDSRGGGEWHQGDEGEFDPGFFSTERVDQPPTDDKISWDSESTCSSSDIDPRDYVRNNRGFNSRYGMGSRAGMETGSNYRGSSCSHNRTLVYGASSNYGRIPVPPPARNVTANKADDPNQRSISALHGGKKLENTYRMEPRPQNTFVWYKFRRPMVSLVNGLLDDFEYNVKSGPAISRKLCEVIMKMAKKQFEMPRYRLVCHVTLVQLKNQGIMIAERALWNTTTDNTASYVHKTKKTVCVVTFYALYYE